MMFTIQKKPFLAAQIPLIKGEYSAMKKAIEAKENALGEFILEQLQTCRTVTTEYDEAIQQENTVSAVTLDEANEKIQRINKLNKTRDRRIKEIDKKISEKQESTKLEIETLSNQFNDLCKMWRDANAPTSGFLGRPLERFNHDFIVQYKHYTLTEEEKSKINDLHQALLDSAWMALQMQKIATALFYISLGLGVAGGLILGLPYVFVGLLVVTIVITVILPFIMALQDPQWVKHLTEKFLYTGLQTTGSIIIMSSLVVGLLSLLTYHLAQCADLREALNEKEIIGFWTSGIVSPDRDESTSSAPAATGGSSGAVGETMNEADLCSNDDACQAYLIEQRKPSYFCRWFTPNRQSSPSLPSESNGSSKYNQSFNP